MRRKTRALFFVIFCFLVSLLAQKVPFVKNVAANEGTSPISVYTRSDDASSTQAQVIWYDDNMFNLVIEGGSSEGAWACSYSNICTKEGENFVCKGDMLVNPVLKKIVPNNVAGTMTSKALKITYAVPWQHCGMRGMLDGTYEAVAQEAAKKYTLHKESVQPITLQEGDGVPYFVKQKNGKEVSLPFVDMNNVKILDALRGTWIDIEYFTYSDYYELIGENMDFYILYKINGHNPLAIKDTP